jgi:hypothetical protein
MQPGHHPALFHFQSGCQRLNLFLFRDWDYFVIPIRVA